MKATFLVPVVGVLLLASCGPKAPEGPQHPPTCIAGIVESGPGVFDVDLLALGEIKEHYGISQGTVDYIEHHAEPCGESVL